MADAAEHEVAHVLRRVCLGPHPNQVDRWRSEGIDRLLAWALDAPPLPSDPAEGIGEDGEEALLDGWIRQLRHPDAALHERLTWFWHGHFTTSADKASFVPALWRQQRVLRRHALGNFRELVRELVTDAAMLVYLDGDGSVADAPNENLSRELMELFTLGRGTYSEDDVRAGARALSGWSVDGEDGWKVRFTKDDGPAGPVSFLGRSVGDADGVVDAVCDHPACAPFIAAKLHAHLVGVAPDEARTAELGALFAAGGLEIRPLVTAIVTHPSFRDPANRRPRYPAEWLAAALAATGSVGEADHSNWYWFAQVGQRPFAPPNVGGWPAGPRWLSASSVMTRAALVAQMGPDPAVLGPVEQVTAVLRRCLLTDVSPSTRSALDAAARTIDDEYERVLALFTLALTSPEFSLL
ncbi:MAG: DUF1800 domain-containing protein [Acidimicrobiales bacterium]